MRDIKNGKFGWYEKEAMRKIETLPFKKQASCKLIYIAICSVSAKNQNSNIVSCYKFDIARYGSVSEKTVQRYLNDLEDLQIIIVSPQDRKSNGKFEKVAISLLSSNQPLDTSETDERQMEDSSETQSPIYIKKEIKKRNKENIYNGFSEKTILAFQDFILHRKQMKSPLTEKAIKLNLNKISHLQEDEQVKTINKSIEYGWKGLFPDEQKQEPTRKNYTIEETPSILSLTQTHE